MNDHYLEPEDYERAKANGIHKRLLEHRFYVTNWDKERAITQPIQESTISKKLIQKAKDNGIKYDQLRWRLRNTDMTDDEAATVSAEELFERRIEKQSRYVTPRIKELAERNGLNYMTVYRRIKKGMDPVKAATEPPLAPKDRVNRRWGQTPNTDTKKSK